PATFREGQTLASTHLTHLAMDEADFARWEEGKNDRSVLPGDSYSYPIRVLYCSVSIEIRDVTPLQEKPSGAPSWDKIINAFLTSLAANAINVTASVVTITTVLITIEKAWSKKTGIDS